MKKAGYLNIALGKMKRVGGVFPNNKMNPTLRKISQGKLTNSNKWFFERKKKAGKK